MHYLPNNLTIRRAVPQRQLRAAVAPLEMVMCMGVFVPIFMLAIFVGVFFIQSADLSATVRNDAWHKRYTEAKSEEYNFQADQQLVDASGDRKITLIAFLQNFTMPKSKHVVLGDAWDARPDSGQAARDRFTELNNHWNMKLQLLLVKNSVGNTLDSALGALQSAGSKLASVASIAQNAANALTGGMKSQLENAAKSAQQQLNDQIKKAKDEIRGKIEDVKKQIADIERQINDKNTQIADAKKRIGEIDDKLKDPKLPDADRKALEKEKTDKDADVKRFGNDINKLNKDKADRQKALGALQKALDA